MKEFDIATVVAEYEQLALDWDSEKLARRANRIFDRMHKIALLLREREDGQRAIESLLTHPNRGVRLAAASDSLAWGSPAGLAALEALVVPRGTHSLDAEMTLSEYRAGRMSFDW